MECGGLLGPYSSAQTSQIQPGLRESIVDLRKGEKGGGGSGREPFFEPEERTTKNWDLFAKKKFFDFDPAPLLRMTKGVPLRKVDVRFIRSLKTLFLHNPSGFHW